MTIRELRELYQNHGFIWNDEIASFLYTYGGETLKYCDPFSGGIMTVTLFDVGDVRAGRKYGTYAKTVEYLGTEIAPVGHCCNQDIEIFLTEQGDLIGFADYLLLSWSTMASPNWEDSMHQLLDGKRPREIGNALDEKATSP